MTAPARRLAQGLRLAALLLLVFGWTAAAVLYFGAAPSAAVEGSQWRIVDGQTYASDDTPREDREIERFGGKAMLWTVELNRWLASLWHGRRLAWTLAIASAALAAGCRGAAALVDDDG